jgi:hypothetical protein
VIDAFLANPRQAETNLRDAGATLMLWRVHEPTGFAMRAPDGLGASLLRGHASNRQERLPQSTEILAVFALKRRRAPRRPAPRPFRRRPPDAGVSGHP